MPTANDPTAGGGMMTSPLAGWGSILLGMGIIVNSLLGPLLLGVIEYRTSASGEFQLTGADTVTMFLVAPVAIASGVLWLRGHWLAPVLSLGASAYAAYVFVQVIIGADYALYDGNNERFFPLHLVLVILSGALVLRSWAGLEPPASEPSMLLRRAAAVVFLGSAVFLLIGLHIPTLLPVLRGEPTADYLEIPAAFWAVKLMDIGLLVPIALATGVGLLRKSRIALKTAYGLSSGLAMLAASVAAMSAVMQWQGDPEAELTLTVGFATIAANFAVLTVRLVQSTRPEPSSGRWQASEP